MHGVDFGPTPTLRVSYHQGEFCVQVPSRVQLYICILVKGHELSSPTLRAGLSDHLSLQDMASLQRVTTTTVLCTQQRTHASMPCEACEGSNDHLAILEHAIPSYVIPDCRREEPTVYAPEPARVATYLYDNCLNLQGCGYEARPEGNSRSPILRDSRRSSPFQLTRNVRLAGGRQLAGLRGSNCNSQWSSLHTSLLDLLLQTVSDRVYWLICRARVSKRCGADSLSPSYICAILA